MCRRCMSIVLLLLVIVTTTLRAAFLDAGATFLTFFPGSKASGMGGAFSAVWSDATAAFYNPASIGFISKPIICFQNYPVAFLLDPVLREASTLYFDVDSIRRRPNWFSTLRMYYSFGGFVYPWREDLKTSLYWSYFCAGEFQATDDSGNVYVYQPYDYHIGLAAGYRPFLNKDIPWQMDLSVGGALKFVYSHLCPEEVVKEVLGIEAGGGTAWTLSADVGLAAKGPYDIVRSAFSYHNIFGRLKYTEQDTGDILPRYFRFGLALNPVNVLDVVFADKIKSTDYVSVTVSFDWMRDNVGDVHTTWKSRGIEVGILRTLYLRWGRFIDRTGQGEFDTKGLGITMGPVSFDVAARKHVDGQDYTNFKITYSVTECPERFSELPFWARAAANVIMPGWGNVLQGNFEEGSLYFILGSLCFEGMLYSSDKTAKQLNGAGLGAVYLVSFWRMGLFDYLCGK